MALLHFPDRCSTFLHIDPKSHISLLPPGIVTMNDAPPSVIIEWQPVTNDDYRLPLMSKQTLEDFTL